MLEAWDEQRLEIDDIQATGDMAVMSFRWVARGALVVPVGAR